MRLLQIVIIVQLIQSSCNHSKSCDYTKDYFPLTSEANLYTELGNYDQAFSLYQRAFSVCQPIRLINHNDLFNYAKCSANLNKQETESIILNSFKQGVEIQSYLGDHDFHKYIYDQTSQKTELWNTIESKYIKIRKQYLESVNHELRDSIYKLQSLDQEFRKSRDMPDSLRRVRGRVRDKEVLLALRELIIEHGYIDIHEIGDSKIDGRNVSISGILLHTPDEERMNHWIPLLKEEIKSGRCSPYTVGAMIDQYYVYNGEKAKLGVMLGTQFNNNQEAENMRKEIGLPHYKIDSIRYDRMRIK